MEAKKGLCCTLILYSIIQFLQFLYCDTQKSQLFSCRTLSPVTSQVSGVTGERHPGELLGRSAEEEEF